MAKAEEKHVPIQQSVRVDCSIEDAFRLFTERFTEWWPLASYSITGEEAENCAIEPWVGGRVFERTRSGEEREWGSVIAWDPPVRLEFTWHPGALDDLRQTINVEFQIEADGTRVTLLHTGWSRAGVETCALHAAYTAQWSAILRLCFSEFVCGQMLAPV
jgi:uncharacterized protein YndB with AHSA1/START domain